jgi:hypothetical protein
VDGALGDAMYALLERHFRGVAPRRFEQDLAEKDWVVVLEDGDGALTGFSTLAFRRERWRGEDMTVVHSGDTIVAPEAWGTPALPRTWIRSVRGLHALHGVGRLWWLLITSGFRTYRFLPVFCRRFHPSADGPPDARLAEMAHAFARRRFGDAYDERTGVVRFRWPQVLREGLDGIPAARRADPYVAFFERLNPGHGRGDELVSLASLEEENLTAAGVRMLHGGGVRETEPSPPGAT